MSYGCPTLRAAKGRKVNNWGTRNLRGANLTNLTAFSKLYQQGQNFTLHFWDWNLKCNLCLLTPPTESESVGGCATVILGYVCKFYLSVTELHYPYGCATLSVAFVCKHYLKNHWVAQNYGYAHMIAAYPCKLYLHNY